MIIKLTRYLFWFVNLMVPKKSRRITICAMPEFDDTTKALLSQLHQRYDIGLLVHMPSSDNPDWLTNFHLNIIRKYSLKGLWWFLSSGTIFYTHGCFNLPWRIPHQRVINLWHGMPIKKVGAYHKVPEQDFVIFDFSIATSDYYARIMSRVFSVPLSQILLSGLPRNDILLRSPPETVDDCLNLKGKKVLIWLPTYRQVDTKFGQRTVDGDFSEDLFNIPGFDVTSFDQYLLKQNMVCLVKLHPMAPDSLINRLTQEELHAVRIVDDRCLQNINLTLYELLARSDVLLTDISSIYIDYLLTEKPIIITFSDEAVYLASRGTIFPFDQKHIPGPRVVSLAQLIGVLDKLFVHHEDTYLPARIQAKNYYHTVQSDFSATLTALLKM